MCLSDYCSDGLDRSSATRKLCAARAFRYLVVAVQYHDDARFHRYCNEKTETAMSESAKIDIRARIADVVLKHGEVLQVILGLCGVLLGLGFLFGDIGGSNYEAVLSLLPREVWGYMALFYGLFKLYGVVVQHLYPIEIFMAGLGGWMWSYLMLSFTVFDPTPTYPTEWLLALLIICEMWSLSIAIFERCDDDS